ncbi:ubiquitin-like protein 4A [Aplysia californica]|uniref:Ubiquitin-like protein 4A n=1 Tax=Aplysia californica TaxID=6500 RepID=A0ABM0K1J0_APLCA|nr:ubiquitin-like protein 4A [Aplysia californica]
MHLTVKILNGEECTLAASPSSLVSDVKEQVQALMSIPVADQKLLFKGKALMDAKPLREYGVEDSCKITLVIKKSVLKSTEASLPTTSPQKIWHSQPESPVWEKMRVFLRRHFRESDIEAVLNAFREEFERNLSSLSLDDIERFAMTKLRVV